MAVTPYRRPFLLSFAMIGLLWAVELINTALDHRLDAFGILPRTEQGLWGIPVAPFLHGNIYHLLNNSLALAIFTVLVLQYGFARWLQVTLAVIFGGGLLVWLLGRPAFHIGASGLVYGYLGFLLVGGIASRRFKFIVIALCVFALFGGLLWGVLPMVGFISWESHLFGLFVGGYLGWALRHKHIGRGE